MISGKKFTFVKTVRNSTGCTLMQAKGNLNKERIMTNQLNTKKKFKLRDTRWNAVLWYTNAHTEEDAITDYFEWCGFKSTDDYFGSVSDIHGVELQHTNKAIDAFIRNGEIK